MTEKFYSYFFLNSTDFFTKTWKKKFDFFYKKIYFVGTLLQHG